MLLLMTGGNDALHAMRNTFFFINISVVALIEALTDRCLRTFKLRTDIIVSRRIA